MKQSKSIIIAVVVAILAIAAIIVIPKLMPTQTAAQVRVAINAPLTGPIAAWSGQFPNGFKMGIEDAARAHGLDPALFVVDIQDNAGKPAQAVSIFNMQKIKGFDAYISVATGPANANAQELDSMRMPHFIAAFDPFITTGYPDRLRVMANSKVEAPLFIEYAKGKQAKSVHVIQINMAYAEEQWSKIIIPDLENAGIKVTRDRFELQDRDFKTIAKKAKVANADLIYVVGYSFHIQPALSALRTLGLVQNGRVLASMDFVDLVHTGTPLEELRDVVFVSPLFDVPGKVSKAADWRKRYEDRYQTKPTYVPAYAYDNATMIVEAYVKSGKINTQSLMSATPFAGINGEIKLDSERDIVATVTLAEINSAGQIAELNN